jgi:small subunit ribosomal protein S21
MLIIEVKKGNIEQALKKYKKKVRNVKQLQHLKENKTFLKSSVKKRKQHQKAVYIQMLKDNEDK